MHPHRSLSPSVSGERQRPVVAAQRRVRSLERRRDQLRVGLRRLPLACTIAAAASPARAPNTVDSATPLPPSRLAPCVPPASSPATSRPCTDVRQSGSMIDAAHVEVRGRRDLDRLAWRGRGRSAASARPCRRSGARPPPRRDGRRRCRTPPAGVPRPCHDLEIAEPGRRRRGWSARADGVVALHEALAERVVQARARAAQTFLEHRACQRRRRRRAARSGWNWSISMSRNASPARQHIAMPSPVFSRAGAAIRYIVADPPVATTTTRRAGARLRPPGADIEHRHAGQIAVLIEEEVERARRPRAPRAPIAQHLVAQAAHDLDARSGRRGAPCGRSSGRANGFWWIRPSGVRSKRQPNWSSSSWITRGASLTSVHASSWSLRYWPPSSVSCEMRSMESPSSSTALYPPCTMRVQPERPTAPF